MKLFFISGLSGSGKTITLNALEDSGFYCIDNLPVGMLEAIIDSLLQQSSPALQNVALGIDVRSGHDELSKFPAILHRIQAKVKDVKTIFLQAEEGVLLKRFSETRRKHPLTHEGLQLLEAVQREKALLSDVSAAADLSIDTSHLNVHQLTQRIRDRVVSNASNTNLSLLIQSFGFKHGVPLDSDYVFDLRCLPNPFWVPELRQFTGRDNEVIAYLEQHEDVQAMFDELLHFLQSWIPRFKNCNRSYVTFSIGCTGGRHRSVYMTERLYRVLQQSHSELITLKHREL